MSNWVDDFNSFEGSQGTSGVVVPGKVAKKPPSKAESIQAELELLEWHKMANDAAMKAALVQTKSMKGTYHQQTTVPRFHEEDAKWMRKVITEENSKPLEVSRDFVLDYERKEKQNAERLSMQVEKHIHTLRNLRGKLEQRADLKSRTEEYRSWQSDFKEKKLAVFEGKTLEEFNNSVRTDGPATNEVSGASGQKKRAPSSDLHHVLDSLTRLSELENRISQLETGNMYDGLVEAETNPKVPQSVYDIEFKKKRTMGNNNSSSMRVMYSVNNQAGKPGRGPGMSGGGRGPGMSGAGRGAGMAGRRAGPAGGGGVAAIRQQRGAGNTGGGGGGGGTFMTGVNEENSVDDRRERMRREHNVKLAQASGGQKSLRGRIQAKKSRAKESSIGEQRHEAAMSELNRRKMAMNTRRTKPGGVDPTTNRATKGAASGIHTKNRHMQEFQNMKKDFTKRKENVGRNQPKPPARSVAGAASNRMGSKTAPLGAGNQRGGPMTKGGGTITRKIQGGGAPTRRPGRNQPDQRLPETAPPAVVATGLKGIRAIRKAK